MALEAGDRPCDTAPVHHSESARSVFMVIFLVVQLRVCSRSNPTREKQNSKSGTGDRGVDLFGGGNSGGVVASPLSRRRDHKSMPAEYDSASRALACLIFSRDYCTAVPTPRHNYNYRKPNLTRRPVRLSSLQTTQPTVRRLSCTMPPHDQSAFSPPSNTNNAPKPNTIHEYQFPSLTEDLSLC